MGCLNFIMVWCQKHILLLKIEKSSYYRHLEIELLILKLCANAGIKSCYLCWNGGRQSGITIVNWHTFQNKKCGHFGKFERLIFLSLSLKY